MYVSLRQPNMYNMLITTTLTSKIDILNIANKKGQHVKSHLRMFLENKNLPRRRAKTHRY